MLIGLFPEFKANGGVQRSCRHMASVLAWMAGQKGMSYQFLSLNDTIGEHQEQVGEFIFRFTAFRRSKRRFIGATISTAKDRPSLIFVAHPNLAPIGWLAKKLTGAKMIVVGYGIDVWEPLPPIRRLALQAADAVLVISSYTAQRIVQIQQVTASKVHLLPLAIEPAFWKAAQEPFDGILPSGFPQGRVLLSVTRLAASAGYKGVDTVIRVLPQIAAQVTDVQYAVVGDGDDRPRLERLSHAVGTADRVHFLGQVKSPELMSCYRNCEAFVLPSKGEGFGLVFLEAMAFGKPVVAGAHGGTLDIVQNGVTGFLVQHGDIERLAWALECLLMDDRLRQEMGQRAQKHVRSNYLYEHFQARLLQSIEDVCGS